MEERDENTDTESRPNNNVEAVQEESIPRRTPCTKKGATSQGTSTSVVVKPLISIHRLCLSASL